MEALADADEDPIPENGTFEIDNDEVHCSTSGM